MIALDPTGMPLIPSMRTLSSMVRIARCGIGRRRRAGAARRAVRRSLTRAAVMPAARLARHRHWNRLVAIAIQTGEEQCLLAFDPGGSQSACVVMKSAAPAVAYRLARPMRGAGQGGGGALARRCGMTRG
jgi:hypothetical protein